MEKPDLIRIEVPLANLDLGKRAPGDIAAPELQLRCQIVLREPPHLPETTYVMTKPDFIVAIHSNNLQIIQNAPIWEQIIYFIIMVW